MYSPGGTNQGESRNVEKSVFREVTKRLSFLPFHHPVCQMCASGTVPSSDGSACLRLCQPGYTPVGDQCQACDPGYISDGGTGSEYSILLCVQAYLTACCLSLSHPHSTACYRPYCPPSQGYVVGSGCQNCDYNAGQYSTGGYNARRFKRHHTTEFSP